jgi:hypothetical protein
MDGLGVSRVQSLAKWAFVMRAFPEHALREHGPWLATRVRRLDEEALDELGEYLALSRRDAILVALAERGDDYRQVLLPWLAAIGDQDSLRDTLEAYIVKMQQELDTPSVWRDRDWVGLLRRNEVVAREPVQLTAFSALIQSLRDPIALPNLAFLLGTSDKVLAAARYRILLERGSPGARQLVGRYFEELLDNWMDDCGRDAGRAWADACAWTGPD